jgi:hypothetical protein
MLKSLIGFFVIFGVFSSPLWAKWAKEIVDDAGTIGSHTSIALDSNNYPHISYCDIFNKDLKYATNASGSWVTETVDSGGDVGGYTSIALDSNNYPHISYYDIFNKDLKYATNASGSWVTETVDSGGDVGEYTSIALDNGNNPHISYYDATATNEGLKYAKWTGVWSIETVDSANNVGQYTSIALDGSDNPHISYYDATDEDLKYAKWTGVWSIEIVDWLGVVGLYNSIALDGSDYPHISYYNESYTTLKYAKWTGSEWLKEIVDNDEGQYTSIALDSNDYPYISYWNSTNYDLKSVKWTGSEWLIEGVDSIVDNVGEYTSIALDVNGYIHISYYDKTNDDLKYAIWTNLSPVVSNVFVSGNFSDMTVVYSLLDPDVDVCSLTVEYQGGSVGAVWTAATTYGSITNITSGSEKTFTWKSGSDEVMQNASDYKIRITPNDGTLDGTAGISDAFLLENIPPAAPSNLSVEEAAYPSLKLSWTDNSSNEAGFKIERKKIGDYQESDTVEANIESCVIESREGPYYYRIYAYNAFGDSSCSNAAASIAATSLISNGCFIATAGHDTLMADEIKVFSRFRDEYLLNNELGRRIVSFYYRNNLLLVDCVRGKGSLKTIMRIVLKNIFSVPLQ